MVDKSDSRAGRISWVMYLLPDMWNFGIIQFDSFISEENYAADRPK